MVSFCIKLECDSFSRGVRTEMERAMSLHLLFSLLNEHFARSESFIQLIHHQSHNE